jgi:acetoacetyl-CoA reductase
VTDQNQRTAIVTGAARGIGSAVAQRLAEDGFAVGVLDLDESACGNTVDAITKAGGSAVGVGVDVADEAAVESAVGRVAEELGDPTVLVNNAGITRDATLKRMNRDMWDAVIDTNLGSCYNMCKLVWDGMTVRKFGRIVNIGSINGQAGQYGQVNYAAAKSGIHGFTKALAQEGARGQITVNAIAPGYVDTEMVRAVPPDVLEKIVARIPMGRLGRAYDIARGVLFLTADDADFITGSTLSINGGQHMY